MQLVLMTGCYVLGFFSFPVLFVLIADRPRKNTPPTKEEWKQLD